MTPESDNHLINGLVQAEVARRVAPLDDKVLENLYAMTAVMGYGISCIDDRWEDLVPKLAVPLLRYLGTPPAKDPKRGLYALQQKQDAEKALKRIPFMLATYADILNAVAKEQRELRKQQPAVAAPVADVTHEPEVASGT